MSRSGPIGGASPEDDAVLGAAYDARLIRRLLEHLRPYRSAVAGALALLLVASLADLAGPSLYRVAIDRDILPPGPRHPAAMAQGLLGIALLYLLILATGFVARWLQGYLMQYVGQRVMNDLRMRMVDHLLRLPVGFFTPSPVGRLVTRVTNDVDALNDAITSGVVAIFGDAATLGGIMAVLLWTNWRLALATFVVLPLVTALALRFRARSREAYRAVRTRLARLNAYLNEQISGMTVTQLFTREGRSLRDFDALNASYLAAHLEATWTFSQFYPAIQLLGTIGVALLLWYGGGEVVRGIATLGEVVAAIQYAERFFDPIRDLSDKFNILQSAMASAERIFRLLDEPVGVQDPPVPQPLPPLRGRIEFQDVWFAYAEGREWALRGVSFVVEPGEHVALVGPTGAGKTSLVTLLARFYDPQRGRILLDGVDVRAIPQRELRRRMGVVPQDVFLFSGTVEDNIRLGDPAIPGARVRHAAALVGLRRFVETLPERYGTLLGERGAPLSGGQKQLLALARALAFDPELLVILDEATSSVDAEAEALIRRALRTALRGRTVLLIAHRLSTVQHADRILVLHKGRLVEEGTHDALLARDGIYRTLYRIQSEAEELRA